MALDDEGVEVLGLLLVEAMEAKVIDQEQVGRQVTEEGGLEAVVGAGLAEFAGGILLAIGLCTRPAAFFILCTMGVAAGIAHSDDPYRDKELALLFGAVAVMFLLAGSGRFSVDRLLR